jgi:hypothetical protein
MTPTKDYTSFIDKRVILTLEEDGEAVEVEATVKAANGSGLLIKPKGKTNFEVIDPDAVLEIESAPTTARALKARTVKPLQHGQARAHLLDKHGWTLEQVNATSEDEAFAQHEQIDHETLGLGHVHGEKASSEE